MIYLEHILIMLGSIDCSSSPMDRVANVNMVWEGCDQATVEHVRLPMPFEHLEINFI